VKSGFEAVAKYLHKELNIPHKASIEFMMEDLKNGRGSIFNNVLKKYNFESKFNVKQCVSVYRTHIPRIHLDAEAEACLKRFKDMPKYLVTDGNKIAQHNKALSLGLYKKMSRCFITHRYGIKNAKPSPYCFLKICTLEKVEPENVVYIADNPNKDFIKLKPLGFKTIRILKGPFKDIRFNKTFDADFKINSLKELDGKYIENVFLGH
jgi:putative hydrolase of the HAD superfamily